MIRLIHLFRYWNLMRRINSQHGIVPELLFDYCGHRHTVGHCHSYLYASQFGERGNILDAGCGSGYGTELLASRASVRGSNKKTIGIDFSPDAIHYCRLMRKGLNLHFVRMDVGCMAFPDKTFGLVTSFEVVEHFVDCRPFLSEVRRVLQPGGRFVLATPNATWRRLQGIANPHHVHEFTYDDLQSMLTQYFDNVQILCRHFMTSEAKQIECHINQLRNCHLGVRLLTGKSKMARLIHLALPYMQRDSYFRWRTAHPLHWYGPQHIQLKREYSDEAYAFLAVGVKNG